MPDAQPPVIGTPPPSGAGAPMPLGPEPVHKPEIVRQLVALLLSLFLGFFLADAVISLADQTLNLWFGGHPLMVVRGIVGFFALLLFVAIYVLMGLTPMIPKRLLLPAVLFNLLGALICIPLTIYYYDRLEQIAWALSICQVLVGLGTLFWALGGFKLRWPLMRESQLGPRRFSWLNLSGFLLVNVFVLLPGVLVYLAVCAALAVGHFTQGFMALRPGGFTVQVRKYVRNDGKTVQLVPMAHVGEADFYQSSRIRSRPTPSC